MATITLYKDKINGVGSLLDDMIKSSNNLNAQLGTWKTSAEYLCTVQIGRRVLPDMKHNLNVMCDHYGIALDHHQADSDSRACAEILLRYMESGVDVSKYVKRYDLSL